MKSLFVVCAVLLSFLASAEIVEVVGSGSGDDFGQALVAAKINAILKAGKMSVASEVKGDRLVRDGGKAENDACLISYEVTGKRESTFDGTEVRIKAKVSKDESDYVLKDGTVQVSGEGVASDHEEAKVLAMCNAVIESGSKIKAVVKYENDELVEDDSSMEAHGFVSECEVVHEGKGEKVSVKCKILNDEGKLNLPSPVDVSGEGVAENSAFAEAVARRWMLLKYGSDFAVHASYKNGSQTSFTAERTRTAYIAAVKTTISASSGGNNKASLSAKISSEPLERAPSESSGLGFGRTALDAHKAALCDAIINRASKVMVSVSYDKGREDECQSEYDAHCIYVGEKISKLTRDGGGYICGVKIKTISAMPSVGADIAQHVTAIGFGRDKTAAVKDAKQRAVDMVFGSKVAAQMTERNGRVTQTIYSGTHSDKGYVADCDVISEDASAGSTIVTINAVVKNHDGDSTGWGWITVAIVLVVLSVVFMVVKKLGVVVLTIVWILAAAGLFVTGHWAVGIAAILLGIGATMAD